MGELKTAAFSERTMLSRSQLNRLLPQLLAKADQNSPLSLLLMKVEGLSPDGLGLTPLAWERLISLSGKVVAEAMPSQAFLGWWSHGVLALLLPNCSQDQALALKEGFNKVFLAQAQEAGFPWAKGEYFLLAAAESAPPAGYCNLGIRAQRELQKLEGRFFPPLKEVLGEEDLLGSFLDALLSTNDAYLARQGALAGEFAHALAQRLNLDEETKAKLPVAARLEDLGMLLAAGDNLWKPGPLTMTEWGRVKAHPRFAAELARQIGLPRQVIRGILCHHEHWDGSGYPSGLMGEQIPLEGRILALASIWAALLLPRPYRPAMGQEEALLELKAISGRVLQPSLVDLAMEIAKERKLLVII